MSAETNNMMRNPYAKRPAAAPENSYQLSNNSKDLRHQPQPAMQRTDPTNHHSNENVAMLQPSSQDLSKSAATIPLQQRQNSSSVDVVVVDLTSQGSLKRQKVLTSAQIRTPHASGNDLIDQRIENPSCKEANPPSRCHVPSTRRFFGDDDDPWDKNSDIDWGAATQQLDQASCRYRTDSAVADAMTTKHPSSLANPNPSNINGQELSMRTTMHPCEDVGVAGNMLQNALYQDFQLHRPKTAIGVRQSHLVPSLATTSAPSPIVVDLTSNVPFPIVVDLTSNIDADADTSLPLSNADTAGSNLKIAVDHEMKEPPNSDAIRPPSCGNNKLSSHPQPKSSCSNLISSNADVLVSLRPAAWTCAASVATLESTDQNNIDDNDKRPSSSTSSNTSAQRPESRDGLPRQELPAMLQFTPEQVQPVQDEYRDTLVKNANLGAPLLNQWTLFPHQRQAILRALLMRRMILALDMGLGKTLIGCVWAKAFKASYDRLKIFVISPVSLTKEWKRTAQEATGLDVASDGGKGAESLDLQICSWAKVPTQVANSVNHFVVVCDEAHHIQSMNAARTRDTIRLVDMKRCVGVLLLTGTPMKNGKPCNLFPLLRAVRHPFGSHQKAFETHFCAGRQRTFGPNRVVWDASGSSNLGVLRENVASHVLYMTKEQCLEDLPPQTRTFRHVPVSSRFQLQHNQALEELAKTYSASSNFQENGTAILGAVQRVRMIASLAKIDATVGLAKEILHNEPAVVIFTSFVKVASSVREKLQDSGWNGELLTGETPANKRQGMVDNFQNGLSPVFVCTFGAGGVGLTLTAACTVILLCQWV